MVLDTTVARRMQTKPLFIDDDSGYVAFYGDAPGMNLSTADSPELSVTGDITIIARIRPGSWNSNGLQHIATKFNGSTNQRSWRFSLNADSVKLQFVFSNDGTSYEASESAALTAVNTDAWEWLWVAVTVDVDNGAGNRVVRFWTSVDGVTWALSSSDSGWPASAFFDSTASLLIGQEDGYIPDAFVGDIGNVIIGDGIGSDGSPGGTTVFWWSGSTIADPSATTLSTYTGQTLAVGIEVDLVLPSAPHGAPVGYEDWRIVIERLNGSVSGGGAACVVGACVVGSAPTGDAVVGTLDWEDITGYWRGTEFFRGADEPVGRPRVGEILLTLDNRTNYFSPWVNYADTRPGTIIRCGLVSAADARANGWLPMWTGRVESWPVMRQAVRSGAESAADSWVDVVLTETLSELANVDDNALPGVIGGGESVTPRIDRLLTAALWRYGMTSTVNLLSETLYTMQSTDMAANRIAELYVTADSADSVVRSDVTRQVVVTDQPGTALAANRLAEFSNDGDHDGGLVRLSMLSDDPDGDVMALAVDLDSLAVASDLEHVRNDIRYARVGGTQQVVEHSVSIGRFGRFTDLRTDLICTDDARVLAVATAANDKKARTSIRVDAATVTATGKGEYYLLLAATDLDALVLVEFDSTKSGTFAMRSMTHTIRPLLGRVDWQCTYALDTLTLDGWPDGAILDPQE